MFAVALIKFITCEKRYSKYKLITVFVYVIRRYRVRLTQLRVEGELLKYLGKMRGRKQTIKTITTFFFEQMSLSRKKMLLL